MTSYRDPMDQERVRQEIENGKGTQFDPRFADIMLEMIAEDVGYDLREKKPEQTSRDKDDKTPGSTE